MADITPLSSLKDAVHFGGYMRQDAQDSLFFGRELEAILPEVVKAPSSALNFTDLIPTRQVAMGFQSITFKSIAETGKAAFVGPKSSDIPSVGVLAKEDTVRYKMIAVAVTWSHEELLAAQAAAQNGAGVGYRLDRDGIVSGRRAIEELVNRVAWYGDVGANLNGLLRQPEVLSSVAANTLDSSSTVAQILAVLNAGVNAIPNNTEQVESANTLLLPPSEYQYCAQTQNSTASDVSILNWWLGTNGDVESAAKVRELANASTLAGGSESVTDCAVFYRRDPSILELPYSGIAAMPMQQQGLNYTTILIAKVGGLLVKRPRAIHILRGV